MIIVFTGGRDFKDERLFRSVRALVGLEPQVFVGDCPTGLDSMVRSYYPRARVFKARWDEYGRAAGPLRNREMLFAAKEAAARARESLFLLSFPGGKGTLGCTAEALCQGIPVLAVKPGEREKSRDGIRHETGQTGSAVGMEQAEPEAHPFPGDE